MGARNRGQLFESKEFFSSREEKNLHIFVVLGNEILGSESACHACDINSRESSRRPLFLFPSEQK